MANVSKDIAAFKKTYRATGSVRQSALSAGYSQAVANMGLNSMPKNIRTYVLTRRKRLDKLAELGKAISAEEQENITRGAIFANIAAGKDQATNSIKLGMQDRRVNMLGGDAGGSVVLIQPPIGVMERLVNSLGRVIEGEIQEAQVLDSKA